MPDFLVFTSPATFAYKPAHSRRCAHRVKITLYLTLQLIYYAIKDPQWYAVQGSDTTMMTIAPAAGTVIKYPVLYSANNISTFLIRLTGTSTSFLFFIKTSELSRCFCITPSIITASSKPITFSFVLCSIK